MCYAAQVEQEFKVIRNAVKAKVDTAAFERLFKKRLIDPSTKIPKAMEANFYRPENPQEQQILDLITEYNQQTTRKLEMDLFKQKARLVEAERVLKNKTTKKALTDQRVATKKVSWYLERISDLRRTETKLTDGRIYPFYYAPVVIEENGERIIRPMRYHCRPSGKPEEIDRDLPGLYNARRDNLEGYWKGQFGKTHAIVLMTAFFEHVSKHRYEQRELAPGEKEQGLILHFNPKPAFQMKVACLWSHWEQLGEDELDSFAAITDEPPAEVSAAGHDRCIVPIQDANLGKWLNAGKETAASLYKLLDDRERLYYEHRMAA